MEMQTAPGRLPPGRRIYVIGDVHGCLRQLVALHALIRADLMARVAVDPVLVHLGDYMNKGPDSAGVLERLSAGDPIAGLRTVNLCGNHERTVVAALDGEGAAVADWRHGGGDAALRSWGIDPASPPRQWLSRVPEQHVAFLRGLRLWHREGPYFFAHAGVRPGVALEAQANDDLVSIRGVFLHSEADFGAVVVHGHTPKLAPEVRPNRINVDTGAVFGRQLTCAVLEGCRVGFLQV